MKAEDLFGTLGLAGMILLGLLPVLAVLGLQVWFYWRRFRRRQEEIRFHKEAGTIGPATLFPGAELPGHYDLLASVGTGGPAAVSLNEQVLRPAIGVRLFVLGLCGAVLYYATGMPGEMEGFQPLASGQFDQVLTALGLFASVSAVVYIFTFEARYDRDVLIVTRMIFHRREYRWKDLRRIGDDGAYELHLHFEPGGKAKVLKHSKGIGPFRAFAVAAISRNRVANA